VVQSICVCSSATVDVWQLATLFELGLGRILIGDYIDAVMSTDTGVGAQRGLPLDRKGDPCWFPRLPPMGAALGCRDLLSSIEADEHVNQKRRLFVCTIIRVIFPAVKL
jgi:hypothetical protein